MRKRAASPAGKGGKIKASRAQREDSTFAPALLRWYRDAKRDLPWRRTRDPYRIWISEVMLQQTRVAAVIPYYERFLERFPDVRALSGAPEADLLARWAGLGYYSRARNLQKAAKQIDARGSFPSTYEEIRELPGIGDYSAAAIASIAFDLPHAVLDGNVARVIARFTAERGNVHATSVKKPLQEKAQRLLDTNQPGEFNQAIMELGATICLPRDPKCLQCPVASQCEARKLGIQGELPLKRIRPDRIFINRSLWVIVERGRVLLAPAGADRSKLKDFWELPEPFGGARPAGSLGEFRHSITHHSYTFSVLRANLDGAKPKAMTWHSLEALDEIPLSTTAKKGIRCWKQVGA